MSAWSKKDIKSIRGLYTFPFVLSLWLLNTYQILGKGTDKELTKNREESNISFVLIREKKALIIREKIRQKGIDLNHDFYVVVGKQYRTENAYTGHQHNISIYIQ